MKRLGISILTVVIVFSVYGQHGQGTVLASMTGGERLSLVKNSITIPVWHEKGFWTLYDEYLDKVSDVSNTSYRSLQGLAETDITNSEQEALDHSLKMLSNRFELLTLRERYYTQFASAFNGVIALQFLQTEAMLDMMECSHTYEGTRWRNYRFHPKAVEESQFKSAKQNTIKAALSIPADKANGFWTVYRQYEQECDALLGEDYSMIALYAGDPADFTPGLAKRLGHDLIQITRREMKLKEKYFLKMNSAVGSAIAARFLAWEDYYSLESKMHAWAEN
jgi:hypothetical protein